MCGIFGRVGVHLAESEAMHVISQGTSLIRHRGPDGDASVLDGGVMMGATRLAILDALGGNQPFSNRSGEILAVFNGEIYNHSDLRTMLAARGVQLKSKCDGEVLPHLYELFGEKLLAQLDGMYAMALWDRRRRRLLLATDRAGIKPLYWTALPDGGLAFSSELRVLPLLTGQRLRVDTRAVGEYLCFKAVFPPRTLYAGVEKFPGGSWLSWENGLTTCGRTSASPACNHSTTSHDVRKELVHAVRSSLQADSAVACIVSGGLDSSIVAALAASESPGLPMFTVGYPNEPMEDERRYARLLAKELKCPLIEVEVSPADVQTMLPRVIQQLEEPIQDPVTVPTLAVMEAVSKGSRVVLTGDGADELFGGYARYQRLASEEGKPSDEAWTNYQNGLYVFHPEEVSSWLDHPVPQVPRPPLHALRSVMDWEMDGRLPSYHLVRVDKLSMACSVEARVPFLRNGVMEVARSLPVSLLTDGREEKRALRMAASGIVPDLILNRRKQPFTFPVLGWLSGPLQRWAQDLLLSSGSAVRGYIPAAKLDWLARRMVQGNVDAATRVWSLLQLEILLTDFVPDTARIAQLQQPLRVRS